MSGRVKMTCWMRMIVLAMLAGAMPYGLGATEPSVAGLPEDILSFKTGRLDGWTVEGAQTWSIGMSNPVFINAGASFYGPIVNSYEKGEKNIGALRSPVFSITTRRQSFYLAGWDGNAAGTNTGSNNFVRLRAHPGGQVLRQTHTPGGDKLTYCKWDTTDLVGRQVCLEVVDGNAQPQGYAWLAFAKYRQEPLPPLKRPFVSQDLYGLKIDNGAETVTCRTVPFLATSTDKRGATRRQIEWDKETIPVGAEAKKLVLLGMMNDGWDNGVGHWCHHVELLKDEDRSDRVFVGSTIGEIEIRYADGTADRVPMTIGATAWFVDHWAFGPMHDPPIIVQEPFLSRPEFGAILKRSLKLCENPESTNEQTAFMHYYLTVTPRPKKIASLVVRDNTALRGRPLVSGVTLVGAQAGEGLVKFGPLTVDGADLDSALDTAQTQDWSKPLADLAGVLYTSDKDLPKQVKPLDFPQGFDGARIRFSGGRDADMLSNLWVANLVQMTEKFESKSGMFRETGKDTPWYGAYQGHGTWAPIGVIWHEAYPRSSEQYGTVALRAVYDPERWTNFVDYGDTHLYFYRKNHDPNKGPANRDLDVNKYPVDLPHWSFMVESTYAIPWPINEIPGDEEMDGHGSMLVARWVAWRMMGMPRGEWLTAPRKNVFGKSRWDATREAADFICWLMDYTGRDVIYSEGESTGWGGGSPAAPLVPKGMAEETDPVKIRANYANANAYEMYPTYACLVALQCTAQMAEAAGDVEHAKKWRAYSERIKVGMLRQMRVGDHNFQTWRVSSNSILPSMQDSLIPAWYALYHPGYDPTKWDPNIALTTYNTLMDHLDKPYGHAAVLGMGQGHGWLTEAALMMDEMDHAGPLLTNIARYSYDKNLDYADAERGVDWRKWLWIIPEGTAIMPDGCWYPIGDKSNGANQGPCMHAMEICAGVDDTNPQDLKIMPRVPKPLTGIEVSNFLTVVPQGKEGTLARVSYKYITRKSFQLKSDRPLPTLAVRLGPFAGAEAAQLAMQGGKFSAGAKTVIQPSGHYDGKPAYWVWVSGMTNVAHVEIIF